MSDSLYRNSIYLMASTFVMAVFGFFFWILNARLYNPENIGIATTIISLSTLISNFSLLGLNAGIIRYLPSSTIKNEKINTALIFVVVTTSLISLFYILGIHSFSPKLGFIKENVFYSILFILFMMAVSYNTMLDTIFTAYRATKFVLFKNVLLCIFKVVLPFAFIVFGAYGIFMSFGIAMLLACLFGLLILMKQFSYKINIRVNQTVIQQMIKFASSSYVYGFVSTLPVSILPIIITNKINASISAYFYMSMMIASLLYIIPIAVSQSLFAEGSYSEKELKLHVKKAAKIILILLTPAIIITMLFGNYILLAFGKQYALEGFTFLQFLAVAGFFVAINQLGIIILNIKHKVHINIIFNTISVLLIIGLSYLFIENRLFGIGIAWIIGQGVNALLYTIYLKKYF